VQSDASTPQAKSQPGLLARRSFRTYSYARFFSRAAQNAVNFALVLLIVEETDLAAMSSLLVVALVIPSTVAGVIAGAAADRFPKRLLSSLGDLARGAICILFAGTSGNIAWFYVVAVLLSSATQFTTAAQGAMGPLIVERHELTQANAINTAVGGVAQLVGLGLLTPVALRLFDSPTLLFWVAAAMFFIPAVQIWFVGRVRSVEEVEVGDPTEGSFWTTGWRAIQRDPAVRQAVIELTLISTAITILGGLIPTYIQDVLDMPVDLGALILSPAAVGIALGLRVASFLARRLPHAVLSTTGFVVFVVMLFGLAFVDPASRFLSGYGAFEWLDSVDVGGFDGGGVLAMTFSLPMGFAFATVTVAANTVMNDRVPLQLQGRVQAAQAAMAALVAAGPVLVAGLLADLLTVVPVIAGVSVALALTAFLNQRALNRKAAAAAPAPGL
jgi:MFS family permease